jgi:hypothetical protein
MTECRRRCLRKGRTERTGGICCAPALNMRHRTAQAGDMAELMNDSALLCCDQQQPEAQRFVHVLHLV